MSLWLLVTGLLMVAAPLTFIYFKKIKEARRLEVTRFWLLTGIIHHAIHSRPSRRGLQAMRTLQLRRAQISRTLLLKTWRKKNVDWVQNSQFKWINNNFSLFCIKYIQQKMLYLLVVWCWSGGLGTISAGSIFVGLQFRFGNMYSNCPLSFLLTKALMSFLLQMKKLLHKDASTADRGIIGGGDVSSWMLYICFWRTRSMLKMQLQRRNSNINNFLKPRILDNEFCSSAIQIVLECFTLKNILMKM